VLGKRVYVNGGEERAAAVDTALISKAGTPLTITTEIEYHIKRWHFSIGQW
jgi:hypothetical protein